MVHLYHYHYHLHQHFLYLHHQHHGKVQQQVNLHRQQMIIQIHRPTIIRLINGGQHRFKFFSNYGRSVIDKYQIKENERMLCSCLSLSLSLILLYLCPVVDCILVGLIKK